MISSQSRTMFHFPDYKFISFYIVQFELGNFCCLQNKAYISTTPTPTNSTLKNYCQCLYWAFLFENGGHLAWTTHQLLCSRLERLFRYGGRNCLPNFGAATSSFSLVSAETTAKRIVVRGIVGIMGRAWADLTQGSSFVLLTYGTSFPWPFISCCLMRVFELKSQSWSSNLLVYFLLS